MLAVAALWWSERGNRAGALGAMATAGLARETALANVVGLWRGPWVSRRAWWANALATGVVALPLAAWFLYVRWKAGPAAQGLGNFTWPVVGWVEKWVATFADFSRQPEFRWLNTTTLLALIALTVQAVFLVRRWRWENPWWRVGACGVAMMVLLGTSVWEGHPGAATRALLPMSVAFAVVAVREKASCHWLVGGGLAVFSGVMALWHVPQDPQELAAGSSYVARLGDGWYGVERSRRASWAWAAQRGELKIATALGSRDAARLRLRLRATSEREVKVSVGAQVLWQGKVGERAEWITTGPVTRAAPGDGKEFTLEIASAAPATREGENPGARALGFAVYGVAIEQ
jgi:hypothetical protein